jgi:hypothetical protein
MFKRTHTQAFKLESEEARNHKIASDNQTRVIMEERERLKTKIK